MAEQQRRRRPSPQRPQPTPEAEPRPAFVPREEMRPEAVRGELRGETSRQEAERLAGEFLERNRHKDPDFHDDFDLKQMGIAEPDGWEYHWKRRFAGGAEDPGYQVQLLNAGWRYVPASRHPELVPPRGHFEIIERSGLVLMECPRLLTDRARALDNRRALERLEVNRRRLGGPQGHFPSNNGRSPDAPPEVRVRYTPMPSNAKPVGASVAMPVPDA